jgi:hypothetical protein
MKLTDFKTEKLAEWINIFNNWDWPYDFIYPKPYDWNDLKNFNLDKTVRTKYSESLQYRKDIESIIGYKEYLRWAHIHRDEATNFQFEVYWFFNHTLQKIFPNLWIDVYGVFGWRKNMKELDF